MFCPAIEELPPPPAAHTGWPWTVETLRLPEKMPNGESWPRISIVTPSFNQGEFIEETIRSVLLQGYPDLEFIIIDGASCDGCLEVIAKYEPWLTYWISESDRGQAHAISKGLIKCSGEIFNWINSDDVLTPNSLCEIAMAMGDGDVVAGSVINFEGEEEELVHNLKLSAPGMISNVAGSSFHQPGVWLRRDKVVACGGINEKFRYVFDWDLMVRYFYLFPDISYISAALVRFRLHPDSKTVGEISGFWDELIVVWREMLNLQRFHALHPLIRKNINLRLRNKQIDIANDAHSPIATMCLLGLRSPAVLLSRYYWGTLRQVQRKR